MVGGSIIMKRFLVTFFKAIFFNIEKIALEFTFNLCPFEDSNGLTPINYVEKATSR